MAKTTTLEVTLAGRAVPVSVQGSGPAVLMLQGGAAPFEGYWVDLPGRLAESATVIQLDRPGVGTSPNPGPAFPLAEQAQHLATVLREVGAGPAVLVGHSFGGPISLQVAADFPELVDGLVMVDPTPINSGTVAKQLGTTTKVLAALSGVPVVNKGLNLLLTHEFWKQVPKGQPRTPALELAASTIVDRPGILELPRVLRGFPADAETLLARLRTQQLSCGGVLLAAGRKPGSKVTALHEEVAKLAGLEFERWEGTQHNLYLQEPDRLLAKIRSVRGLA